MQDFPETRHSLLVRVQRDDGEAWEEFSKIYRPVIYRIARLRGWQDADAQDLSQQVLVKISSAISRFEPDPSRARFRTWLRTVCHHALVDALRSAAAAEATPSVDSALEISDAEVSEEEVTLEHRRQVFRWAARNAVSAFAPSTWQAFWQSAVEGRSPTEVAQQLGLSVGAVYTARSRVMRFLQQKVKEYDDAEL